MILYVQEAEIHRLFPAVVKYVSGTERFLADEAHRTLGALLANISEAKVLALISSKCVRLHLLSLCLFAAHSVLLFC